ncbi:nuclear transport factor 2 family protein [Herbaspirillum robiniae]|uniref:SnoaL-like domain-containing protein n=1 Tax=Herbaspirillum robiniae TaxID=2014887 RepID=A0ABX2LYZ2_9BURK|nr:nuclear transport factor 2 family protein [Herbaspirillum robiniae]NUU02395.1 SnoaL-like domain-containing protein [Herbaspirillum robiniae]
MSIRRLIAVSILPLAGLLSACTQAPVSPQGTVGASSSTRAEANKRNALAFYDAFFNRHDLTAAQRYVAPGYIQHNPRVASGRDAFVNAFTQIFARYPQRRSTVHKAIADGDLVALHVHTVTGPDDRGMAIVDIFRFDGDGKIVEHWDVMQPVPESTASGNGMFD